MESVAPVGRVYRMTWLFRGFALFSLVFGCLFFFASVRDLLNEDPVSDYWKFAASIVLPIVGAVMSAHAFVSRIVFTQDSFERFTLVRQERIPLNSIRGRREYSTRAGSDGGRTRYLRLERNDGEPPADFGKGLYSFDNEFWSWFNALPDMDEADKVKHKDSNFGLV